MKGKRVRWLADEVTVPPFSQEAASEVGALIEVVALGGVPPMPHSRPIPSVGLRCHELRVRDRGIDWRIVYHITQEAIVVLDVFRKKTRTTPRAIIDRCMKRLRRYEREHQDGA